MFAQTNANKLQTNRKQTQTFAQTNMEKPCISGQLGLCLYKRLQTNHKQTHGPEGQLWLFAGIFQDFRNLRLSTGQLWPFAGILENC
ncbi:MAG: hypothetical protein ABFE07_17010, partial [Armatimonadia bacterium]